MKRPKIGTRIVRGLQQVHGAGEHALDEGRWAYDPSLEDDVRLALKYLEKLCVWYQARAPRKKT